MARFRSARQRRKVMSKLRGIHGPELQRMRDWRGSVPITTADVQEGRVLVHGGTGDLIKFQTGMEARDYLKTEAADKRGDYFARPEDLALSKKARVNEANLRFVQRGR